ncbi:MAG: 3-isopropylmalate dehydratase large subunit, partial [Clostridia bacterium]|nr:3-isopropylmalate dehydratase large subunit [Deltaproteobacteria bacterium]
MSTPTTLFEKIWQEHIVSSTEGFPSVLYIDLHLVHEVTSPQAFAGLDARGLKVRRPDRTVATMDHSTPTLPRSPPLNLVVLDDAAKAQLDALVRNCEKHGVRLYALGSDHQGIVHVIGPELGFTQPGMTIVCGDSHTATHGAFGSLAFGIGTSEVEHVLATQCLLQRKPKTLSVRFDGTPPRGVTAKDLILAVCAKIGVGGATGYVIEYYGDAVRALSMEGRMTVCNMSIEAGARAGLIAPDETTFAYLKGREFAPKGDAWDKAITRWRTFKTDEGATFDREVVIDATKVEPMITWGTNPGMGISISGNVPKLEDAPSGAERDALEKALNYMGLTPGQQLAGQPIDVVFIGSCTNSRISDLRAAASVFAGRKVKAGVRTLIVPGSADVKKAAEAEGLDRVFKEAVAEWREAGCSMCIAMNGDQL